jgi:murein DD-endopeptidase MepM/ murein hydrolase activator NlpD
MATGTVEDASCGNPGFGCQVAIRHFTGNTVMIYAHLKQGSITVKQGDRVSRGDIIGKAGSTGTDNIHLHIELRDGSDTCSIRCLPGGFGGNPIGWDDLVELVDDYHIGGYLADSEGLETYNYDGSAVKGDVKVMYDFRYLDQPGNIPRKNVIARVHSSFECDSEIDCEDNSNPLTQFADSGFFGGHQDRRLQFLTAIQSSQSGQLISSNVPNMPTPSPPPSADNATFVSDVTIPDGTVVSPGQALNKVWRVRNSGTSTWDGYRLEFVGGDQMGAPALVSIDHTSPGHEVDISVAMMAPSSPGDYAGYWQIVNAAGAWVEGGQLWVKVKVQDTAQPDDVEIVSVNYPTVVEPGQTFRPEVTVRVNSGSLLQNRGDMLRNTDGNLYGAWPHVAVEGSVGTGQTYTFRFYENDPITAPTTEGTYTTKWQVWADGRFVGPEVAIEFRVFEGNRPPPAPQLHTPEDYASSHENPSFCVHTPTDPDGDAITGYQFETVSGPTQWQSSWQEPPYNCSERPQLVPGDYTWRARVRDSQGNVSDWSQTRHFTKLSGVSITRFEFDPSSPSGQEHIKIYTDGDVETGETIIQFNTATDGSASGEWKGIRHYSGGLDLGTNHETDWYTIDAVSDGTHLVRLTINANDGTDVQEKTYTVLHRRPAAPYGEWPVQSGPSNRWTNSRTVTIKWRTGLPRTDSYHLVVSDGPNPISDPTPLLDRTFYQETTEYTHTFDTDYEDLYWYIAASNDVGTTVGGDNYHFGIDLDPPTSTVEVLPAVSTDIKFTVNWSGSDARSGLRWYDVQVRDGERGEWVDWMINTTNTAAIFAGQPGHTYYFRVRAMDEVGNWESYPAGDGDTYTLVDPTAAPSPAWWDTAYSYKRNLVILNNDSHGVGSHYPVHLHFDLTTTPTADEIYNASQAAVKGNDVRVVYQDQTELDRFVQEFSATNIDIWFALQAGLGSSQSDSTNYQLYYGNAAAGTPSTDINDVFQPTVDEHTVALWHFQEGTGSTVYDTSGRGHNGSFSSPGWTTDGRFGNSGAFNGSSSEVNFGNHSDFNLSAMTLEAWIYLTEPIGNYPHLFNKETYWLRITGGRQPHFKAFGCEAIGTCPQLEPNRWYHVAATYNGSNDCRLYVNGQMCNQKIESHTPNHTSAPFKIGWTTNWPSAGHFPGRIHHARVSDIARDGFPDTRLETDPEVQAGTVILPPGSGTANLVVQQFDAYPADSTLGGGLIVRAVVRNEGDAPTTNGFYTDLYVDHLPAGAGDYTGSVRFWIASSIEASATVTLTTVLTDVTGVSRLSAAALGPLSEVFATLYVQADSTGVISEPNNADNISTGTEVCIASPDAYESDDITATAQYIALGESQTRNFSLADEDWITFTVSGGVTYTIQTSDLGPAADTYLYLYDTDGSTLLAANDDYGGSLASRLDWTVPLTGTYYLLVKHWNPNTGGCGTAYDLTVNETSVVGFTAWPISGVAPLTVVFTHTSTGGCTAWLWDFGDGVTSTLPSPTHTYTIAGGVYTVTLTVGRPGGTDMLRRTNCIAVYLFSDLDHDCDVDVVDVMLVASCWNTHTGDPDYDPAYDFDNDGDIDIVDIMQVAAAWGNTCNGTMICTAGGLDETGPTLRLVPLQSHLEPGERVDLAVEVQGADNLGGVQFDLLFDPAQFDLEGVTLRPALGSTGNTTQALEPLVDPETGRVTCGAFSFGEYSGPDAGQLMVISLMARRGGAATVGLDSVQLVDLEGQVHYPASVEPARLTIGQVRLYLPLILRASD